MVDVNSEFSGIYPNELNLIFRLCFASQLFFTLARFFLLSVCGSFSEREKLFVFISLILFFVTIKGASGCIDPGRKTLYSDSKW